MLEQFYNDNLRKVSEWLRLHSLFKFCYDFVNEPLATILPRFFVDEIQATVGETNAKFSVSTKPEYKRVKSIEPNGEISVLVDCLRTDDILWDVGANIGTHTVFAGKKLIDGSVVSFEPYPPNVERLRTNVKINNLKNVHIVQSALGSSRGELHLNLEGEEAGHGGHSLTTDTHSNSVLVDVLTGDSLTNKYGYPNVLKIDVQGEELNVLKGLDDILQSECRLIFCEVHKSRGVKVSDIKECLTQYGFHCESNGSGGTIQLIAEKRQE